MSKSSLSSAAVIGALILATATFGQNTNIFPASGNVGIGTITPAAKLDIQAAVNGGHIVITAEGGNSYNTVNSFKADGSTLLGLVARAAGYSFYGIDGKVVSLAGDGMYCRWIQASGTNSLVLGGGYGGHMTITSFGNVGIGTTNPLRALGINGGLVFQAPGGANRSIHWADETTGATPIMIQGFSTPGSEALCFSTNAFGNSGIERMRVTAGGNVGIGTTNPTNKLEVNGTIRTKEVIVETTGWSDYVFAPDYRLASLSEVEAAIKADGHLPGMPSAAEVAEHGVSLGDMQARMLAKIEELTLHQIELSKQVSVQSTQLDAQSARIAQLEAENAALRTHPSP